jgi:glycerate dehydrogenase
MIAPQQPFADPVRIVVLDGHTNNPGDLSWQGFENLGECTVYATTTPEQLSERAGAANIVLTNKTVLAEPELACLPNTRYIGVLATGVNVVDLATARQLGIAVTNVPNYGSDSVAQHTIGLLLACACRVSELDRSVQQGEWQQRGVFSYWNQAPIELRGKTLGLIGLGAIGHRTAHIAMALGMNVIAYTPSGRSAAGISSVSLPTLQREADAISLHCPLTDSNYQMIDRAFLARIKPGAMLINTARGDLLEEAAVANALHSGQLSGIGVDVLSSEPPADDNPLLTAPNCTITPHIAWATKTARARLLQIALANLAAFLEGKTINRVA